MKKQIVVIATLAVCLVLGTAAFAKSNIGLKGVGGEVGFVSPEGGIGSTIGFGAVADLGWITPQISLGAEAMYWSKSYDAGVHYSWSYSQIYISAIARYFFAQKKGASFSPYAGAGLGLVMGKVKSKYTGPNEDMYGYYDDTSVSNTGIGIHLVGGTKMALSPKMDGFVEARYSLGGDAADIFGLFAGVIFKLK